MRQLEPYILFNHFLGSDEMTGKCDQSLRKKYKVINWPEYDEALENRGNIAIWVSEDAIEAWTPPKNGRRGRQPKCSDLAIEIRN